MIKFTKRDEIVAQKDDGSSLWEVVLTTTFIKDIGGGENSKTFSVKTFDNDLERAIIMLNSSVANYFSEVGKTFEDGEIDVKNKSNEISTA